MPRYIDAEKLIKTIFPIGLVDNGKYTINAKAVKVAIDRTPTADVVEVVRCKDCKWCLTENWQGDILYGCDCAAGMNDITPNDYCSYGERKEK
jgi:hypothetical protein